MSSIDDIRRWHANGGDLTFYDKLVLRIDEQRKALRELFYIVRRLESFESFEEWHLPERDSIVNLSSSLIQPIDSISRNLEICERTKLEIDVIRADRAKDPRPELCETCLGKKFTITKQCDPMAWKDRETIDREPCHICSFELKPEDL